MPAADGMAENGRSTGVSDMAEVAALTGADGIPGTDELSGTPGATVVVGVDPASEASRPSGEEARPGTGADAEVIASTPSSRESSGSGGHSCTRCADRAYCYNPSLTWDIKGRRESRETLMRILRCRRSFFER